MIVTSLILFSFLLIIQFSSCNVIENKESLFSFDADERLFTAFAFMNAAGFDGEWRDEGMNPIRKEIRNLIIPQLDSLYKSKIEEFHFSHSRGSWGKYAPYALITAGPPNFNIQFNDNTTPRGHKIANDNEGLSVLLSEFYEIAQIRQLWIQYKSDLNATNKKYDSYAMNALDDIVNYCRSNKSIFYKSKRKIHFLVCPQMSYFTAQNVTVNGDLYLIHGPTDSEPSESAFYHEALHEVINPITKEHISILNKYEELLTISKEKNSLGYEDWESIVNESFVRTIDVTLQRKLFDLNEENINNLIMNEYKLGFILCPFIYENLSDYENSSESLDEYFPKLISKLNIENEISRWERFWAQ